MTANKPTKSQMMTAYNKARAYARKHPEAMDEKVVNRAFGYAQSASNQIKAEYHTTIKNCQCPYSKKNPDKICKHRADLMILHRAHQTPIKVSRKATLPIEVTSIKEIASQLDEGDHLYQINGMLLEVVEKKSGQPALRQFHFSEA